VWRNLWFRISGFLVCTIAILLPYRMRLGFAGMLNFLGHPLKRLARLMAPQVRFWNKLILGGVFWLGFPVSKLMLRLGGARGRSMMAPPHGSATYWVKRVKPEVLNAEIDDPF